MTESTVPAAPPHDVPHEVQADHSWFTQFVVLGAAGACFALAWYVGAIFHVPVHRGFEGSLLQQSDTAGKAIALILAVALTLASGIIGQFLAGRQWVYAGPFAAATALSALSMRAGPSRYAYFEAGGQLRAIPLVFALELALLGYVVGAVWLRVTRRARATAIAAGEAVPRLTPLTFSSGQAVFTQAALMAFGVMVLAQTDDKKQVLLSVLLAATVATAVAEHFFKAENAGEWYWIGPIVVGLLGYVGVVVLGTAGSAANGHLAGPLAALARPLPLDYASFGIAGALMGYWISADHAWLHRTVLTRLFGETPAPPAIDPTARSASPTDANVAPASGNGQAR